MKPDDITKEMTIQGPQWPEPVWVLHTSTSGEYFNIKGWMVPSKNAVDDMIPIADLEGIQSMSSSPDMSGDPTKVFLAVEAIRYRFASMYDPLLAIHSSRVDPLPHQIEAVYKYVLHMPRIRFLLAHDTGAGKTIMAGLIIKELKMRKIVSNVLIVVPGHLRDQWRRELKEKFDESVVVVDRNYVEAHYGENVWVNNNTIVTSIDFAKQNDILRSLGVSEFDLTVVDEAHKMSAFRYGNKTDKTERYRLGETLSQVSEHLLFLTATPHRGDPENFRLFLDLLEPGFFATSEMIQKSIDAEDNPLFLRRVKEDMKNFDGKPLFVPRNVKTIQITLSNREMRLYDSFSKYVRSQYNKAMQSERRNITFALIVLQRRMASSTYALLRSLERRKNRLEEILYDFDQGIVKASTMSSEPDMDILEDKGEAERWREEEKWEALSMAENRDEMDLEIQTIIGLIADAKEVIKQKSEQKLKELRYTLECLNNEYSGKKILIFTESKDTLQYLEKSVRLWGYSVNTIHGGMELKGRVRAEAVFRNETQVMVATEAAGEGINLQFCHLMINYDLPWNPNRLEQRMGRVHRYGQQFEVTVFNMVATNTREGQIMEKLFDKLKKIKSDMNSDKVFDVITEFIPGMTLHNLMKEVAANTRSMSDILQDLDVTIDKEYEKNMQEALKDSLATKYMNHGSLLDMRERARADKLNPEYTGEMFELAFALAGGKVRKRADGLTALDNLPADLRRITDSAGHQNLYGHALNRYLKVSFDKDQADSENAEFMVFGHPVFEAVLEWIIQNCMEAAQQGAAFADPTGMMDGYILFHEIELRDGTRRVAGKRLVSHFVDADTWEVHNVQPSFLWDLKRDLLECGAPVYKTRAEQESLDKVLAYGEGYKRDVLDERRRQAGVKRCYGLASLDKLITDLDSDLATLRVRSANGEDVQLPIHNKEDKKNQYEMRRTDLQTQIEQEQTITMAKPCLMGWARVVPDADVSDGMRRNPDVELKGMLVAMEYERQNDRSPEDISAKNTGYDIFSRGTDGETRYIEVKARAAKGRISLTSNELKVARNLGSDYYLYVIYNALGPTPYPLIVQDPGHKLPMEHIEVRYDVSPSTVEEYAQ